MNKRNILRILSGVALVLASFMKAYWRIPNILHTNRGATPMRADAACATTGFYGAPVSGTGSHLRRHFSLSLEESPLQALKNALDAAAFFTPATCAPLAQLRVLRGKPKKPYAFRGEANATLPAIVNTTHTIIALASIRYQSWYSLPLLLSRSAEGFSGPWPRSTL